jgi:Multiubiquitin
MSDSQAKDDKGGGNSGSENGGGNSGGGNSGPGGGDKVFEIKIDRKEYKVRKEVLKGSDLRKLPEPDIGPERDLFEVVPGGSDLKIENQMDVKMRDGLRFFTAPAQINPGAR